MSIKKSTKYLLVSMLIPLLSACHKHTESMFGTIPSIFENEMKVVTKVAQKNAKGQGTVIKMMAQMADSAFSVASQKSQDEINNLKGMYVNSIVDTDVDMKILSDVKIEDITLPNLSRRNEGMMSVTLSFDAKTKDKKLFYILEGFEGMVGCGIYDVVNLDNKDELNIVMNIAAPNVPAKYQQSCKTIRFVTPMTFLREIKTIERKQIQWRHEYKKQMDL